MKLTRSTLGLLGLWTVCALGALCTFGRSPQPALATDREPAPEPQPVHAAPLRAVQPTTATAVRDHVPVKTFTATAPRPTAPPQPVAQDADDDHEAPAVVGRPDLDAILADEEQDIARTATVSAQIERDLASLPGVGVASVRCVQAFCKTELTLPDEARTRWEQVDQMLAQSVARGETWFQSEDTPAGTRAHIYFSTPGAVLPVSGE